MSSILDDPELEAIASQLGMGKRDLDRIIGAPSGEGQQILTGMKARLKERFNDAAFEIHPDRNPDDPDAARKFRLLHRVKGILENIWIEPARPVDPLLSFVMGYTPSGVTCKTTDYED